MFVSNPCYTRRSLVGAAKIIGGTIRRSLVRISRLLIIRQDPARDCGPGRSELVAVALLLALALRGLDAHLLVVLLQRREVLAGLGELSLFHTLAHIPMYEGTLGVHEVKLVVDPREHL